MNTDQLWNFLVLSYCMHLCDGIELLSSSFSVRRTCEPRQTTRKIYYSFQKIVVQIALMISGILLIGFKLPQTYKCLDSLLAYL